MANVPSNKEASAEALRQAFKERDEAYAVAREKSHAFWEVVEQSPLNVSEIARALGVSRGAVYSWKRQKGNM